MLLELRQECDECLDTFDRHGIVHVAPDARVRGMARNVQNLVLFCLCDQLRLQVSVLRNPEVAIVLAAVLRVCLVDIVPTRFVEEIVEHLGLDLRLLLVCRDAASLVLEAHVQAGHIDAPARWCVVVSTG